MLVSLIPRPQEGGLWMRLCACAKIAHSIDQYTELYSILNFIVHVFYKLKQLHCPCVYVSVSLGCRTVLLNAYKVLMYGLILIMR